MSRRLFHICRLLLCLIVLVGLANVSPVADVPAGDGSNFVGSPHQAEALPQVSVIAPAEEAAWLAPQVDLTGCLYDVLLVTAESAELQQSVNVATHERWICFFQSPVAPFGLLRSLPLQI